MTRVHFLPLWCVGIGIVGGVTLVGAGQRPQFQSGTHTVSIHATVVDRQGQVVTDLDRDDFEVYDNGALQNLTLFDRDIQPITIVVMLDRSGSMASNYKLVRDAAGTFIGRLLPDDRARIGSFSDRIEIGPEAFTSDHAELARILREDLRPAGPTPLWNATAAAMDALAAEEGRRVVLLFTDGRDTPAVGANVDFEQVRARARIEETMVYAIGLTEECGTPEDPAPRIGPGGVLYQRRPRLPGLPPRPRFPPPMPRPPVPTMPGRPEPPWTAPGSPWERRPTKCTELGPDPELRELTLVGGGGYFELRSTHDLASTFTRVAHELHHQYLLAFTATNLDNTLHELEVRVRHNNATVRARRGYMAEP